VRLLVPSNLVSKLSCDPIGLSLVAPTKVNQPTIVPACGGSAAASKVIRASDALSKTKAFPYFPAVVVIPPPTVIATLLDDSSVIFVALHRNAHTQLASWV